MAMRRLFVGNNDVAYTLARSHYEPLLAEAAERLGALSAASEAMKASVEKQNAAIADLRAEARKREREAARAVKQARERSAKDQARAQAVLMRALPVGLEPCVAARADFDEELRDERGGR